MEPNQHSTAIIVAGGRGLRLGSSVPKQYLELAGKPILVRTLDVFEACPEVDEIILVVGEEQEKNTDYILSYEYKKIKSVIRGGDERQLSVYNGLLAVRPDTGLVLVHDGVRPFVSLSDLARLIAEACRTGAAVLGTRVTDTLKKTDDSVSIAATVDRTGLWAVQTPQAFFYSLLMEAYEKAFLDGVHATDDCALVERLGYQIHLVEGQSFNMKITTAADLAVAAALIKGGYIEND